MTKRISGFVSSHFGAPFDGEISQPSVLVHGHVFCLIMRYHEQSGDTRYDGLAHRIAKSLAAVYAQEPSGILPSYPGIWWPTDNRPALAALKKYDMAFQTGLANDPCQRWVNSMRTYYRDPKSGLICGYVSLLKKEPLVGPRGVGIMFAFPFLVEVDDVFAREQYALAQKHLVG